MSGSVGPVRRDAPQARWVGARVQALDGAAVESLLAGEKAFLCLPGFMAPEDCARTARRALESERSVASSYGTTATLQLGQTLGQMTGELPGYFAAAAEGNRVLRQAYAGGPDPTVKMRALLERIPGWKFLEAAEPDGPYATDVIGTLRKGSDIPLHCDAVAALAPLRVAAFERVLAWNVYLLAPESGGELIVHRRAWRPEDEALRDPNGIGFLRKVVDGCERALFRPRQGELVVFPADHYHEVLAGSSDRMTGHSFLGVSQSRREFTFWA